MHPLGILGCGWLGIPLGIQLQKEGYQVRGSRTSNAGIKVLSEKGIDGYRVLLEEDETIGIDSFLDGLKTLIISIPPGRTKKNEAYEQKIKLVIKALEKSTLERILFLSSTSVYGSAAGTYDEASSVIPETISAKAIYACEQALKKQAIPSVIVRLGGLIGADRNPIIQLQEKTIPNPKGRINFIDQNDAVNGIISLIANPALQGVFNLVSPHHPVREIYYKHMAKKFALSPPKFSADPPQVRIIKGQKITSITSFHYTVDNLLI
jgi:nucleoside-diphosphate-sugar epimerase